jgi:hypothetical protein
MRAMPPNPGTPAHSLLLVYRAGESCPVCQGMVDYVDYDVSPYPVPGTRDRAKIGGAGQGAVLLPCGHHVDRCLAPGNGETPARIRLVRPRQGM